MKRHKIRYAIVIERQRGTMRPMFRIFQAASLLVRLERPRSSRFAKP